MRLLFLLSVLSFACGFAPHCLCQHVPHGEVGEKQHKKPSFSRREPKQKIIDFSSDNTIPTTSTSLAMMIPRGGASGMDLAASLIETGPYGVPTLWAVASAVLIPLTLYRQGFSFSVGYGFSVMAMGLAMWKIFAPAMLAGSVPSSSIVILASTIFYGFRLGSFLLLRNQTVKSKRDQMKEFDKSPPLKRIPLALSVGLFYAFLVTPVLYNLRGAAAAAAAGGSTGARGVLAVISDTGAAMSFIGALLEAIADGHKFLNKRGSTEDTFRGPTGGVYRISRHPNYLGEVVFWFGVFLGGIPSFGRSVIAWVCSSLGLFGIYSIMAGATRRLDEKQLEKYGGQPKYDEWRASVKGAMFP